MPVGVGVFIKPEQRLGAPIRQERDDPGGGCTAGFFWKQSIDYEIVAERKIAGQRDGAFWDFESGWFIELWLLGKSVGVVSLGSIAIDPIRNQIEFSLREALIIAEVTESLDRTPRRHAP